MVENKTDLKALEVVDIHKSFFDNHVLKGISFDIGKGEILGLVGSNGAGKSTLMKIVNGIYKLDSGMIKVNGETLNYNDSTSARKAGIAMVYQEFSLIPTMTVTQNMFLGVEKKKNGLIDDKACREAVIEAFEEFGVDINPDDEVENLSMGNQQVVEIVKALMQKPSVLILDEPTASLTHKEIELLFELVGRLKKQGIAIFLISHHMQEIIRVCDRVVVLRNGNVEIDDIISNVTIASIVEAMIGKKLAAHEFIAPKNPIVREVPVLEVVDLTLDHRLKGLSFRTYPGEILGIAGLLGSGRTEILKIIYGLLEPSSGHVMVKGEKWVCKKPWKNIDKGVFLVPENRRKSGIIGIHSIEMNMMLPIWQRMSKKGFVDDKMARANAEIMKAKLQLKATGIDQEVETLSGGNQQKVVFAKSLLTEPSVLLLDEPTVGVDVEAKSEIANLIREIANNDNGVLLVSSEMDEMERLCDRVLILKKGEIVNELIRSQGDIITEQSLSEYIQM